MIVTKNRLDDLLYTYRFHLLLITLLLNFFVAPFATFRILTAVIRIFTTTCLLLSGANFIQKEKRNLRNAWFSFGLINIAVAFATNIFPSFYLLESLQYFLMFLFFVVITVNLIQQIISINEVDMDVLIGAFCGYLLVGVICFFVIFIVNAAMPEAYSGVSSNIHERNSDLFYFAFTCLTTLGFGDILPVVNLSQKIAVFTAAIGQFYIAVVVALLISRFMEAANAKKKSN
jgi:hypothetical protein